MASAVQFERSHSHAEIAVRDARPEDNTQLIALAESCSMAGDIGLRMERRPDFFALNRLEGESWRLAVAERDGIVVGCICYSERESHFEGGIVTSGYVGDLKVHPDHRDGSIADALTRHTAASMSHLSDTTPVMITVLAGNVAMERRLRGPRGLPRFTHVSTIRTYSIPILWRRGRRSLTKASRSNGLDVRPAEWADLEEMANLWRAVSHERELSPMHDANSLERWIRNAPGLDIADYRLARSRNGSLVGFMALWDQRQIRQLCVVNYSMRMNAARYAFNTLAPLIGSEPLPRAGMPLNLVTATNLCVPQGEADVLRALLVRAHDEMRHSDYSVLNIGLDTRDSLNAAMHGLLAQPTDIEAYLTNGRGGAWTRPFRGPLHYEIALV